MDRQGKTKPTSVSGGTIQWMNNSMMLQSIGWKLRILEIKKLLTFWTVMSFWHFDLGNRTSWCWWSFALVDVVCKRSLNVKLIGCIMRILETWPILTFWRMLTFCPMMTSKIQWNRLQILFKFEINRVKIEDFRNLRSCWPFGMWCPFAILTSKIRWSLSIHQLQQLVKFREDRFKIVTSRRL